MDIWNRLKERPWIAGLLTGLVLMMLGAAQGQPDVVFQKAIRICLECIGIG